MLGSDPQTCNETIREVNLATFRSTGSDRGASKITEAAWVLVRSILFERWPGKCYALKRSLLRLFGAKVGKGVVIKPGVKITFPWRLDLGNYVWLGEDSWLLNLALITIEDHVCISQRAMLCTGNHDYTSTQFKTVNKPIHVECGAWIAAQAWVGPGVHVGSHAVLTAGSVASQDLDPYGIYRGNPALKIRQRHISPGGQGAVAAAANRTGSPTQ
ncbi:MAG TPA: WcaF family extracellular polysaccharide biosynthesis acetyltransferase [Phycisphaerae bacterium]|nr:WcaF family extracellular polysaccharide biosynthesis acetyltransferase [Phycisphaerae bacterium]HUU90208.1 WcaF family extracellular polysaccharide biosynthesis acetyltransferase [Phycisphaerae bacterium]